jgi:hypothetical protein
MAGDNKKSMDPAVLAAIITVVGGIVVALITVLGNKLPSSVPPTATPFPTWTDMPTATITLTPVPTDTVPAGEPSSTPAPDTPTPQPTATIVPPVIGDDWANNCISALWQPYPNIQTEQKDGCLVPLVDKFYTANGHLAFSYSAKVQGAETHGLFAQLPASGTVSLKFHLTDVTKGEILIGIFSSPDVNTDGVVLVVPSGKDVKQQRMLVRTMPNKNTFSQSSGPLTSSSATYDVAFTFDSGNISVKLQNNQINLGTVKISSPDKWLFIGYQAYNGVNNLQADFFNLSVQK